MRVAIFVSAINPTRAVAVGTCLGACLMPLLPLFFSNLDSGARAAMVVISIIGVAGLFAVFVSIVCDLRRRARK